MDSVELQLPYGKGSLQLDLPRANLLGVFLPKPLADTADENQLISGALAHPLGTPKLPELVKPGDKIAIVTSDLTRPCPSARLLPPILAELKKAGIPDQDIFIVLGLGLHRPMTGREMEQAVSTEVFQRFRVLNHDFTDTVHLGLTSAGTPVEIFRPLVEADVRICLGNVEFHYFAGYSGGAKAIFPGCASRAGINANHAMMVRPEATAGRIEGNPLREDIEEAVSFLGADFILNVVVDSEHRVVGAVAGDLNTAHRIGCEMVAARGIVPIPRRADIVLASAGGYPKDINFYQAHKTLEIAAYAVKAGGIIILVAECREGFAHQTFESWFVSGSSPAELIARIQQEFVLGGHKVASLAAIRQRAGVYLVSNLPTDKVRRGGLVPFEDPQIALETALAQLGPQSEVLVFPQVGSLLPVPPD